MFKFSKSLVAGLALCLAGLFCVSFLASCARLKVNTAANAAQIPYGDQQNVAYSQELWAALAKAQLVGGNAKPDKLYAFKGKGHAPILETVSSTVWVRGQKGKVVVKRNYGPSGVSIGNVNANRGKYLKAIDVMYRREAGYDPDNNDWFWVKYKPDGTVKANPIGVKLAGRVAKGMEKGCIACHSKVKEKGYVFRAK